jgi:DNA-binding transcriptional MerR regulator
MNTNMNDVLAASMKDFALPKFGQLPDMGLYLEQTAKYINQCFAPLGTMEITGSMIRNYVKMGLVKNPVKKQYYRDQIAHLMAITILKPALSLENIQQLFQLQRGVYTDETAYDYLCMELKNTLDYRFGVTGGLEDVGRTKSIEKEMLRSAVSAVAHIVYLDHCFRAIGRTAERQNQELSQEN